MFSSASYYIINVEQKASLNKHDEGYRFQEKTCQRRGRAARSHPSYSGGPGDLLSWMTQVFPPGSKRERNTSCNSASGESGGSCKTKDRCHGTAAHARSVDEVLL